jgi:pentatricopeptide repeat protein
MDIMENANTCNVPIVYVKLMNLYGKRKDIGKAEEAYKESMQISDSCNILKYKILASSEMEKSIRRIIFLRKPT